MKSYIEKYEEYTLKVSLLSQKEKDEYNAFVEANPYYKTPEVNISNNIDFFLEQIDLYVEGIGKQWETIETIPFLRLI